MYLKQTQISTSAQSDQSLLSASLPEEARSLLSPNSRSLSPKKVSKVADLELNENPEGGLRYRHGQMRIFIFCQWLYSTDVWESIEASADCRDVQTNLSCLHIQLTILICNKLQHPNFQVWKFHVEILVTAYPKNPKYWDKQCRSRSDAAVSWCLTPQYAASDQGVQFAIHTAVF